MAPRAKSPKRQAADDKATQPLEFACEVRGAGSTILDAICIRDNGSVARRSDAEVGCWHALGRALLLEWHVGVAECAVTFSNGQRFQSKNGTEIVLSEAPPQWFVSAFDFASAIPLEPSLPSTAEFSILIQASGTFVTLADCNDLYSSSGLWALCMNRLTLKWHSATADHLLSDDTWKSYRNSGGLTLTATSAPEWFRKKAREAVKCPSCPGGVQQATRSNCQGTVACCTCATEVGALLWNCKSCGVVFCNVDCIHKARNDLPVCPDLKVVAYRPSLSPGQPPLTEQLLIQNDGAFVAMADKADGTTSGTWHTCGSVLLLKWHDGREDCVLADASVPSGAAFSNAQGFRLETEMSLPQWFLDKPASASGCVLEVQQTASTASALGMPDMLYIRDDGTFVVFAELTHPLSSSGTWIAQSANLSLRWHRRAPEQLTTNSSGQSFFNPSGVIFAAITPPSWFTERFKMTTVKPKQKSVRRDKAEDQKQQVGLEDALAGAILQKLDTSSAGLGQEKLSGAADQHLFDVGKVADSAIVGLANSSMLMKHKKKKKATKKATAKQNMDMGQEEPGQVHGRPRGCTEEARALLDALDSNKDTGLDKAEMEAALGKACLHIAGVEISSAAQDLDKADLARRMTTEATAILIALNSSKDGRLDKADIVGALRKPTTELDGVQASVAAREQGQAQNLQEGVTAEAQAILAALDISEDGQVDKAELEMALGKAFVELASVQVSLVAQESGQAKDLPRGMTADALAILAALDMNEDRRLDKAELVAALQTSAVELDDVVRVLSAAQEQGRAGFLSRGMTVEAQALLDALELSGDGRLDKAEIAAALHTSTVELEDVRVLSATQEQGQARDLLTGTTTEDEVIEVVVKEVSTAIESDKQPVKLNSASQQEMSGATAPEEQYSDIQSTTVKHIAKGTTLMEVAAAVTVVIADRCKELAKGGLRAKVTTLAEQTRSKLAQTEPGAQHGGLYEFVVDEEEMWFLCVVADTSADVLGGGCCSKQVHELEVEGKVQRFRAGSKAAFAQISRALNNKQPLDGLLQL